MAAHPCVHALASLILSPIGARAQAQRLRDPGRRAGRTGRGRRRRTAAASPTGHRTRRQPLTAMPLQECLAGGGALSPQPLAAALAAPEARWRTVAGF